MQEGAFGAGVYNSFGSMGKGAALQQSECMQLLVIQVLEESRRSQWKQCTNAAIATAWAVPVCQCGMAYLAPSQWVRLLWHTLHLRPELHMMWAHGMRASLAWCSEPEKEEGEEPGAACAVKAGIGRGLLLWTVNRRQLHELRPPGGGGAAI